MCSICARFYTSTSTKMKIGLIWATWSWVEKMLTAFWKMKREYVLIEICHFFEILFCPQCNVVLNFRNLALVPYYYWHDVFSGETTSAATTVFFKRIQQICHWNSKTKAQLMWMLILHICIYVYQKWRRNHKYL